MKYKFIIVSIIVVLIGLITIYPEFRSFEHKRAEVINNMESLIAEKSAAGEYRCCIEPACTMCFMGNWLWDDGICRCDDMIATGEFDKVCPQCEQGLEEGLCKSSEKDHCDLDNNFVSMEGESKNA